MTPKARTFFVQTVRCIRRGQDMFKFMCKKSPCGVCDLDEKSTSNEHANVTEHTSFIYCSQWRLTGVTALDISCYETALLSCWSHTVCIPLCRFGFPSYRTAQSSKCSLCHLKLILQQMYHCTEFREPQLHLKI